MKNQRYIEQAIAELRANKHLPERTLALSDDDIMGVTLSVYNVTQEIAAKEKVTVPLELDDDVLLDMARYCAKTDITISEFVEAALRVAISEAKARYLYEVENPEGDWARLSDEARNEFYIRSDFE